MLTTGLLGGMVGFFVEDLLSKDRTKEAAGLLVALLTTLATLVGAGLLPGEPLLFVAVVAGIVVGLAGGVYLRRRGFAFGSSE